MPGIEVEFLHRQALTPIIADLQAAVADSATAANDSKLAAAGFANAADASKQAAAGSATAANDSKLAAAGFANAADASKQAAAGFANAADASKQAAAGSANAADASKQAAAGSASTALAAATNNPVNSASVSTSYIIDFFANSKDNQYHFITLTGNVPTLTLTNVSAGRCVYLKVTQGGAGSFTITFPASCVFPGGASIDWHITPGKSNIFCLVAASSTVIDVTYYKQ
ncbi:MULTISPECIES: hypothetical protein [unclassified Spirosoma]|uniref:hypothetical protein n=1 Tax=unclassified Spirosoma TaxID=2621999 RepID=UPI00096295F1|nr:MULTISPECIES: hypothetical protein [unclassified Spirosoma]MBN8824437.1 hypothetical protein [Spirosoma sp.]OJW70100.1 MAG: hypothetical protein BGO59_25840 [Spirosoma sp. 48-14]